MKIIEKITLILYSNIIVQKIKLYLMLVQHMTQGHSTCQFKAK